MIKVLTLRGLSAWDITMYGTEESDPTQKVAFESSALNRFTNNGWTVKDWNVSVAPATTLSPSRVWTFILEKK